MLSDLYLRIAAVLFLAAIVTMTEASPYLDDELGVDDAEEYNDNSMDRFMQPAEDKRSGGSTMYMPMRRSCIRRGGNCDNRATDCCYNSTCRCNLWGSNCKCSKMGLFQKWGK